MKKITTLIVCLLILLNIFIPTNIHAITKNEATDFVNTFINTINESSISEIKKYLENYSEDKIVEIFRIAETNYPKTSAYFNIARSLQEIGNLQEAYKYYSKAVECTKGIKNMDHESKAIIFKFRAVCNFLMMRNIGKFDKEKTDRMFNDFDISLQNNANDYDTFFTLGIVYVTLENKTYALKSFEKAKDLCPDSKTKKEIQKYIDNNEEGFMDWVKEHSGTLLVLGAATIKAIPAVLSFFGGGNGGEYQEE